MLNSLYFYIYICFHISKETYDSSCYFSTNNPKNVFIYSGIIHFDYIFITLLHACIILDLVTNWNDKKFAFITKQ